MNLLNRITKILNCLFYFTAVLFVLDELTDFDIRSQWLKSIVYYGILIGPPAVLICNLIMIKNGRNKVIACAIPAIFLLLIIFEGPMKLIFASGVWKTQTIKYQKAGSARTVEFQLQDKGALGYNKRTVEVLPLTPLFMIVSNVPENIDANKVWIRIESTGKEAGIR